MSTIDDVMRLPISDEAKEYYRQNKVFFDSGWTESLNKPRVAELLSLAELQCFGLVEIQISPSCADIPQTEAEMNNIPYPEEYKLYRKFTVSPALPEIILGVEMIGDWIKKLQETTGMFVKTVTFRQDRCIDVVIPSVVVFHAPHNPDGLVRLVSSKTQHIETDGKN